MATYREFTEDQFIELGLTMPRNHRKHHRKVEDFKSIYGAHPKAIAAIWKDLQTTPDEDERIDTVTEPYQLLIVYRWFKSYESEKELHTNFGPDEKDIRQWCKEITAKIAALRKIKVCYETN